MNSSSIDATPSMRPATADPVVPQMLADDSMHAAPMVSKQQL
jgi:hypothetical protein